MKKILNLLIVFFLLTSCHYEKEKIRLNLIVGEVYTQNSMTNISLTQIIDGKKRKINTSIGANLTYKVIDKKDSVYEMEVNYKKLSMLTENSHGRIEYSSDKNDTNDIISTILGTMKNKPFYIKMTDTGKIIDFKNTDTLYTHLFDQLAQLNEAQRKQVKVQFMQAYGAKTLKSDFEVSSAIFPVSPVSEGNKWTINTQLESGMPIKIKSTYKLQEINNSYYHISGKSQVKTSDSEARVKAIDAPLKYDMSGTMTSDIKIDRKSGWVIETKLVRTLKGTAQKQDNSKKPIEMSTVNEIKIMGK